MGPSGSAGGRELQKWLEGILAAHGVGVFGDLPYPGDDRAAGRHRLQVLVWDQEDGRLLLLPRDADELGLDPDGLRVSLAVRMATTPPWGLDAVVHTNPVTGRQHRLVDGSLRAGFPVDAFDVPGIPRWPTFGVRMHDDPAGPLPDLPRPAWSSSLPQQDELLATALSLQERMGLAPAAAARTIDIDAQGTDPLAGDGEHDLEASARSAVDAFLAGWDFGEYVRHHRTPESTRAREYAPLAGGSDDNERHVDLVLDAALSRTSTIAGAVVRLEQHGYAPRRVLGGSGGAVVGALLAAGYAAEEAAYALRDSPTTRFRARPAAPARPMPPATVPAPAPASAIEGPDDELLDFDELDDLDDDEFEYTAVVGAPEPEPATIDDKHIAAWLPDRPPGDTRPLVRGQTYMLKIRVGRAVFGTLLDNAGALIPAADVPAEGLDTRWTMTSEHVALVARAQPVMVEERRHGDVTSYRASFPLRIPRHGDSDVIALDIIPRHLPKARIEVEIDVGGEPYRRLALDLDVDVGAEHQLAPRDHAPVGVVDEDLVTPAAHLGIRAPHEWQTPAARLSIRVGRDRFAAVKGDVRTGVLVQGFDDDVPWDASISELTGLIENVRRSAEALRSKHDAYLNDLDPADLEQRLAAFAPVYDWSSAAVLADPPHVVAWDAVAASPEMRALAYDGHQLYRRVFPEGRPDQPLRTFLDAMLPGDRLDISWTATADGIVPHIPWGLMYVLDPTAGGANAPIDGLGFLGLRLRLAYRAYRTPTAVSWALGAPDVAWRAHLLYWGGQPNDKVAAEADLQRRAYTGTRDLCVPAAAGPEARAAVLAALRQPEPAPTTVLHLFCRSDAGDGNEVALQFGSTNGPDDVLRRYDLPSSALDDRPLVFANACGTSASNPYYLNELERGFFDRGARAFIGTEARVPPVLAARFATAFFHFFTRRADPLPMAGGEALAQARLFLWTNFRNVGGLFYAYINEYELYLADDDEVAELRS